MANFTRNFSSGIMNKMVDERLIPNGQYVDALNVRMGSTELSEVGVIENSKGNTLLTSLSYDGNALSDNARCIGAFEDGSNETIYWFIHDGSFPSSNTGKIDLIVSYDVKTESVIYHIISMDDGDSINTTLNFDSKHLITGVNKIEDLFYFTDNYTDPKQINVKRNYPNPSGGGIDGFSLESLLVIKKPPTTRPTIEPMATSGQDNFLEDRFISFAYRYRYEDGEYSATSQFSAPSFIPKPFDYSRDTALNEGMLNSTNACKITYNSGGPLVKSVDLLFKDMNSSVIKIIEKINKEDEGIADDTNYQFTFNNSKIFTILPSSEILRLFDNVPLLAKSQTLMGNRLMYANYLEGYDLKDINGNPTKFEYFVDYSSKQIGFSTLGFETTIGQYSWNAPLEIDNSIISADLTDLVLKPGSTINFLVRFQHSQFFGNPTEPDDETQDTVVNFLYTLIDYYDTVNELALSDDFKKKIGTDLPNPPGTIETVADSCTGITFTDLFNCAIPNELSRGGGAVFKYQSGRTQANQGVYIVSSPNSNSLGLQLPTMLFVDDPLAITVEIWEYYKITIAEVDFQQLGDPKSLHSNRGYEIGIVYMDEYNRMSTAQVSPQNNIHIPCIASDTANSISITIPTLQVAPYWAKRYKFVIKPDKKGYNVIYSNFFFRDSSSGFDYFLLDGQNSSKVESGDEMIVKADTEGPLATCAWTTVLEKETQKQDFLIPKPSDSTGAEIPVPGGVYMKLQANNFSTTTGDFPVVEYGEHKWHRTHGGCPYNTYPVDVLNPAYIEADCVNGQPETYKYIDYTIPPGSIIKIHLSSDRRGIRKVEQKTWNVDTEFTSPKLYANFEDWFRGENIAGALEAQGHDSGTGVTGPGFDNGFTCSFDDTKSDFLRTDPNTCDERSYFRFKGTDGYSGNNLKSTTAITEITVIRARGTLIFESDPADAEPDLWYESSESYSIDSLGQHSGDLQDQNFSTGAAAIINSKFFNCYAFGNGAESYKIEDAITGKELVLGNRATTTNSKLYGAEKRFSDITYSGIYNTESNINKLNEFNIGLLNFKILESSFGPINKLFARETDILTLQEDKISYVLGGKNLLSDAGGGNALVSVPEVLGIQIARVEEFGISHNPESFSEWGPDKFFTDAKRGTVLNLKGTSGKNEQLIPISQDGMRPWFRDLFNSSFATQKLGGFDPYMNEFVLSSNQIKIPITTGCKNCGITESVLVSNTNPYTYCYDVGELTGFVNIEYDVELPITGTFEVIAIYNGVVTTTGSVSTGGTLTFLKDDILVNEVSILVQATDNIDFGITVNCPIGDTITLVLVSVSGNPDLGKQIHNEYKWVDGTFQSPLQSNQVTFLGGNSPIVSLYDMITGPQGGSNIPTNSSVITIISDKYGSDTYDFNPNSDNFRYLRTNTLYNNNTTDIRALLVASTIPTPTNPPSGGNTDYNSTFAMPTTGDYLYLVWDYRDSTPIDLCVRDNVLDSCCDCPAATNIYELEDCVTGTIFTVSVTASGIGINSVISYRQGVGGSIGTYVSCGRLMRYGTTPDATIYSNVTTTCGNVAKCNFDSTIVCSSYTVSTYSNTQDLYTYTNCTGVNVQALIGGTGAYQEATFCAITSLVDPGSNTLTNNGVCP